MTASSSKSDGNLVEGRARRIVGWAVVLGGILGALLSLTMGDSWRRSLFDEWQRAAPRTIAPDRVAVVLIDSLSLEAVGPWPWPRYYIARLTEGIAVQQPKAIGFDVIFAEPDALNPGNFADLYRELDPASAARVRALPTMDETLAKIIGSAPVLLARLGVKRDGLDPATLLVDPAVAGNPPSGLPAYKQVLASIPELDDVALAHAMINGPPDDDGNVRRVPLAVMAGKQTMPGFAVELARLGADAAELKWRGNTLALGNRLLPADAGGRLAIRMGHVPSASTFSALRRARLRRGSVKSRVSM